MTAELHQDYIDQAAWEADGGPDGELTPFERARFEARMRRVFRVGRAPRNNVVDLDSRRRQRLEPFLRALVDLLVVDLARSPSVVR